MVMITSLLIKARSGCLLMLEVDLVYVGSVLESELQQRWRYVYVAVPGRNQTLFRCVFQSHYCVQSALAQNFR